MTLLDRDDCVLVVVDAQPRFLGEGSEAAVARMAWLVAVAERLDIPVVVTEEDAATNGTTVLGVKAQALAKPVFGIAGNPEILAAVRATGRGTAVLVGAETDVCVAQSAIGLAGEGMRVVVVDDATFSPGEMHARGLARAREAGIEINHAKGVAYEWVRTVADARRVLRDPALPDPGFVF